MGKNSKITCIYLTWESYSWPLIFMKLILPKNTIEWSFPHIKISKIVP